MVLLGRAIDEGRGVVIVINKYDLVDYFYKKHTLERMKDFMRKKFALGDLPILEISAINLGETKREELCETIIKVNQGWNRYCAPKLLTDCFLDFKGMERIPRVKGKVPILKKLIQVKARPPTFQVFANVKCGEVFGRTMMNKLRKEFDFAGVPLRLRFIIKKGTTKARSGKKMLLIDKEGDSENAEDEKGKVNVY